MTLTTLVPGGVPRASELNGNFTYLEGLITGGAAIKTGSTMAQLIAIAAAAPTQAFQAIPTDLPALVLYTGSATRGPDGNGFVTILTWEEIS